jgi:hypothetical protein
MLSAIVDRYSSGLVFCWIEVSRLVLEAHPGQRWVLRASLQHSENTVTARTRLLRPLARRQEGSTFLRQLVDYLPTLNPSNLLSTWPSCFGGRRAATGA